MLKRLLSLLVLASGVVAASSQQPPLSAAPSAGFVPDSITAVRIAVAVWEPIYGQSLIQSEAPFKAVLRGRSWIITGTNRSNIPGGVAVMELAKSNAEVLLVAHGK